MSIDAGPHNTVYSFDGATMFVSLNGRPLLTGETSLVSFSYPSLNIFSFSSLLSLASPSNEAFSLAILFPSEIVEDGKIVTNLPVPRYGELAYIRDSDAIANTFLDIAIGSSVPEPAIWLCLMAGLFLTGVMIRRSGTVQAADLATV